jgi:hypothetical protein
MPVSDDRIFQLAMVVIAFQLSIPIAAMIMPVHPISQVSNIELLSFSLSNWTSWVGLGTGALALVGGLVYRISIGAVAYAAIFTVGSIPLGATLDSMINIFGTTSSAVAMLNAINGAILALIVPLFIWTFIKLAR